MSAGLALVPGGGHAWRGPGPGLEPGGGHVLLRVGLTTFALPLDEVQEVVRATQLVLLPASGQVVDGRPVALCDVRGRAVPVVDLRADPEAPGDVVVPVDRATVGAVVDRVVAVVGPGTLAAEDVAAAGLPDYARGVLRPVAGGEAARVLGGTAPVLAVALPALVSLPAAIRAAPGTATRPS